MNNNIESFGSIYYNNLGEDSREEKINTGIYSRNVPTRDLEPNLPFRPVSTKYTLFPIVDERPMNDILDKDYTYNRKTDFNPGNTGPWKNFTQNINTESTLRNQFFALQKGDQAYYIPNSTSDMYTNDIPDTKNIQSHEQLFKEEKFDSFNPNSCDLGKSMFNNCTREQLKRFVK